ncbi:MAG: acetyl-CoA carboxylase biotin carboxyl carrier protein subunit [Actinomycetales bacterium]|nr:acetyl-CoA carboxylase biotin carboxyl carrier protein subunit [Actinomycetales bacterium]
MIHAKADIVGTMWQILGRAGDRVSAGQVIAVMESMKMEIPVAAPADGRLGQILVGEGQIVQEGDPIAEILPDGSP